MACFLAPVAEAIAVTVIKKRLEKQELHVEATADGHALPEEKSTVSFSRKLGWLTKMLWGGSFLLAIEHIWHGEIVPWPPFLTAVSEPGGFAEMMGEIASVGVCMALIVTAVWGVMLAVSNHLEKSAHSAGSELKEG